MEPVPVATLQQYLEAHARTLTQHATMTSAHTRHSTAPALVLMSCTCNVVDDICLLLTLHLSGQSELQRLDVSGCRDLTTLSIASPQLQELLAASCGRLCSITLASRRLQTVSLPNCARLSEVNMVPLTAAPGGQPAGSKRRCGTLNVNGCVTLPPAAAARLAEAVIGC
jgi:hypothetical protein